MAQRWLSSEAFATHAQAKDFPPDTPLVLRKTFVAESIKTVDDAARTLQFQITTDGVDRDRDLIAADGWDTTDYLKNPIVLWAHDYRTLPVARTLSILRTPHGLSAVAQFPPADVHPFADTVYRLIKGGYLNASSVGFRPIKWAFNEDRRGVDFFEQQLLEWSIVPVPANVDTLVEARAAREDLTLLKRWATYTLAACDMLPLDGADMPEWRSGLGADVAFQKGVVPSNVSTSLADVGTAWSAPSLADFTADAWGDLSETEQRHIAGHFAWADASPPSSYGGLKLPHHRPSDGAVVWRGVAAAAARLSQAQIPSDNLSAVKAHLSAHYRAFGKKPPWDGQASLDVDTAAVDDLIVPAAEIALELTDPPEESLRLSLAVELKEDPGVSAEDVRAAFRDALREGLPSVLAGVVAREVDRAVKVARGQAV